LREIYLQIIFILDVIYHNVILLNKQIEFSNKF